MHANPSRHVTGAAPVITVRQARPIATSTRAMQGHTPIRPTLLLQTNAGTEHPLALLRSSSPLA